MSITSSSKTSRKNRSEIMAEIDFMLAEMKKADIRIAAHQAESDILSEEIRESMVRIKASNIELRNAVEKLRQYSYSTLSRRTHDF